MDNRRCSTAKNSLERMLWRPFQEKQHPVQMGATNVRKNKVQLTTSHISESEMPSHTASTHLVPTELRER